MGLNGNITCTHILYYFHSKPELPACENMLQLLKQKILPLILPFKNFLNLRSRIKLIAPNADPDMFNRIVELQKFTQLLKSPPGFTVVTGPVNSGKSRLIDCVVTNLATSVPVQTANLRKGTYSSVQSLVRSLSSEKMTSWLNTIREVVDEVSISELSIRLARNTSTPLENLNTLLQWIVEELPSYSKIRGKHVGHPILFIDEANRLSSLLCDKHGEDALQSLFEWLVLHTKEKRHFHVIMASSDSFFNLWIERYIGSSRYNT